MALNKELLLKVADAIEQHPKHFDIGSWVYGEYEDTYLPALADVAQTKCGTTACIGGWAAALGPKITARTPGVAKDDEGLWIDDFQELARHRLGLTEHQADALFYGMTGWWRDQAATHRRRKGTDPGDGAYALTPKTVAKVLRGVANGEIPLPAKAPSYVD